MDGKEDVMVMVVDGRCLMTFAIFYLFFPPFSPQFYRRPSPQFLPDYSQAREVLAGEQLVPSIDPPLSLSHAFRDYMHSSSKNDNLITRSITSFHLLQD